MNTNALFAVPVSIQYLERNGNWHHYQSKQNQAYAYGVAQRRAVSTDKRHRLVDGTGNLLDILNP